jgi:predicted homoserine dehydrogenase-like protein
MVQVGIIGIGSMGKGLLYQSTITPGVHVTAIYDKDISVCLKAATEFGIPHRVVSTATEAHRAIMSQQLAICKSPKLVVSCNFVHVFLEASSSIFDGGIYCRDAITNRKHAVLMNSEVDLIYGPYLMKLAKKYGVTYTSCDGDQHGVLKRLMDEVSDWGFRVVLAGNIKGFLDRYTNPTLIKPEADKRNLSYQMCTAYTDGTKLSIEMALLANATGFVPPKAGMTGVRLNHVNEVMNLYNVVGETGYVDYILGAEPGGGVFVLGHSDNKYQQDMMKYYKMGDGPTYLFYRPYHLCHVEAMRCIQQAAIGESLLEPKCGFVTNVYAYAKKDLKRGDVLDGVGGYTCYGMIDVEKRDQLPICLADDFAVTRDIKKDEPIRLTDIDGWGHWVDKVNMYYEGL